MKKLLLLVVLALGTTTTRAQSYTREGNTFVAVERTTSADTTGYYWQDAQGESYPILMASTGSVYIVRVSRKSGKPYRQYLGREISEQICREIGREYKPKSKSK